MTWFLRLASLVCRSVSYYITLHDWVIKWFQTSWKKWAAFKLIKNAASGIFPLTSHDGSATKNVPRAHESRLLRRLKCSPSCILLINRDWTWGRGWRELFWYWEQNGWTVGETFYSFHGEILSKIIARTARRHLDGRHLLFGVSINLQTWTDASGALNVNFRKISDVFGRRFVI